MWTQKPDLLAWQWWRSSEKLSLASLFKSMLSFHLTVTCNRGGRILNTVELPHSIQPCIPGYCSNTEPITHSHSRGKEFHLVQFTTVGTTEGNVRFPYTLFPDFQLYRPWMLTDIIFSIWEIQLKINHLKNFFLTVSLLCFFQISWKVREKTS